VVTANSSITLSQLKLNNCEFRGAKFIYINNLLALLRLYLNKYLYLII